jgi:hypothetical protein
MNIKRRDVFTKMLAVAGTTLAGLPVLAPLVFSILALITRGRFLFDYLMPAELFPLVLLGGGLLLWASLRVHSQGKRIGWSLGVTTAALVIMQELAVITGLASGEREAEGWRFTLVLSFLVLFWLALIALSINGIWLLCRIFKSPRPPAEQSPPVQN